MIYQIVFLVIFCSTTIAQTPPGCKVWTDTSLTTRAFQTRGLFPVPLTPPPWLNTTKVLQGQKFARDNIYNILLNHLMILTQFYIQDFRRILLLSGKTNIDYHTTRRYTATAAQVTNFYFAPFSTDPKSDFQRSIIGTHDIHMNTLDLIEKKFGFLLNTPLLTSPANWTNFQVPVWQAFLDDMKVAREKSNITEYGPSTWVDVNRTHFWTQGEFTIIHAVWWTWAGVPEKAYMGGASLADLDAYTHLWAIVGYYLGIADEFNGALQPSFDCIQLIAPQAIDQINTKYIFYESEHWSYEAYNLWNGIIQGMTLLTGGIIDTTNMLIYLYEEWFVFGPATNMRRVMSYSPSSAGRYMFLQGANFFQGIPLLGGLPTKAMLNTAGLAMLNKNTMLYFQAPTTNTSAIADKCYY